MKQKITFTIILKAFLGVFIAAPFMVAAFLIDRVILVFIPFVQGPKIQDIFKNLKNFEPIAYRTGALLIIFLFHLLFSWLF